MVSGTLPLVIYTVLLVNERINASSSIQWAQSTLGEPVLITGHPMFQFTDTNLSGLLPRGVGFSLSCMAICLAKFPLKVSFALLFQAIKYHGQRHSVMME
jgi:hypothetical protein